MVELRHLRYFTAVAEHGGIGTTARILHVAQSAISEQIRDLESELGVSLFDRKNRRIRLTYHGERFLKDARAVLAVADRAVANVQKSIRGEVGTLTIGFFVGRTGNFFPRVIKEFRHRFADVQVHWWRWHRLCSTERWRRELSKLRLHGRFKRPMRRSSGRN